MQIYFGIIGEISWFLIIARIIVRYFTKLIARNSIKTMPQKQTDETFNFSK